MDPIKYLDPPYEVHDRPLWWHVRGLSFTASGYGKRIPSRRMVKLPGETRLRRVYVTVYSNSGSQWILIKGQRWYLGTWSAHKAEE